MIASRIHFGTARRMRAALFALLCILLANVAHPQSTRFHVIAFYSKHVEADHVDFALQAIDFFSHLAASDNFDFTATDDWQDMNAATLSRYQVVLWFNDSAHTSTQRAAFQHYMEHGGAWMGFHAAGYNDKDTGWPWYVQFLGGAVFYGNSWPPLAATLSVDDAAAPMTKRLPATYKAPANEWYSWQPNPRANKDVKVWLTLSPANYPLGLKDTLNAGDIPVVWSNTQFRMIYMNMGHGDKNFTEPVQNHLFEDTLLWLGRPEPGRPDASKAVHK